MQYFRASNIFGRKFTLSAEEPLGTYSYRTRGPFLERPGNLTGAISHFQIKVSRRVGCVLPSNEVHFVSLADNFTVPFSKVLKLPSLVENKTV